MTTEKGWVLKGTWYESCRQNGQCPLWFRRDITGEPCISFQVWQIKEGQVQNIDMKGIIIINVISGIGPKFSDHLEKRSRVGASYVSDNATKEQREILEPFVRTHLMAQNWGEHLGVKFVKINRSEEKGIYHASMPFGEQKMSLAIGGDGKNPIRNDNPVLPFLSNSVFCNAHFWKYNDYGKDWEFRDTSAIIGDFTLQGED